MPEKKEISKIIEFFRNSTIFITGGTGFVGKVLIHKLLSTCDVSCIYFLVRQKSSKSTAARKSEFFEDSIFLQLKNKLPDYENRINFIEGDCSLENLGLSANDENILCESVNFVIHCAAAMNMMGSLKTAVKINIRGTQKVFDLSKKMTNLKAFVYTSTLIGFAELDIIDEKVYESHLKCEDYLNLLKIEHILPLDQHITEKIMGDKSTIYALTKAASENIFIREKVSFPVVIFRFALASPCWKEPIPGWTDGFYGPNGIFAFYLLDIAPAFYWNDTQSDATPADLIVNALIAAIQYSHDRFQKSKDNGEEMSPIVYNYSTKYHKNSLSLPDTTDYAQIQFNIPSRFYYNKIHFFIWSIMFGYIPAIIIDLLLAVCSRKKNRLGLFKMYNNVVRVNLKLANGNRYYKVNNNNIQNCWENLNNIDKKLFSSDLNEVIWDEHKPRVCSNIRERLQILLKENRKIRLAAFWIPKIRFAFKVLYYSLALYCIYFIYGLLG